MEKPYFKCRIRATLVIKWSSYITCCGQRYYSHIFATIIDYCMSWKEQKRIDIYDEKVCRNFPDEKTACKIRAF